MTRKQIIATDKLRHELEVKGYSTTVIKASRGFSLKIEKSINTPYEIKKSFTFHNGDSWKTFKNNVLNEVTA